MLTSLNETRFEICLVNISKNHSNTRPAINFSKLIQKWTQPQKTSNPRRRPYLETILQPLKRIWSQNHSRQEARRSMSYAPKSWPEIFPKNFFKILLKNPIEYSMYSYIGIQVTGWSPVFKVAAAFGGYQSWDPYRGSSVTNSVGKVLHWWGLEFSTESEMVVFSKMGDIL